MREYKKLSHVIYKCEHDIVWVSKYRLCILKGEVGILVEKIIRMLCEWKSCEVQELSYYQLITGSSLILFDTQPSESFSDKT